MRGQQTHDGNTTQHAAQLYCEIQPEKKFKVFRFRQHDVDCARQAGSQQEQCNQPHVKFLAVDDEIPFPVKKQNAHVECEHDIKAHEPKRVNFEEKRRLEIDALVGHPENDSHVQIAYPGDQCQQWQQQETGIQVFQKVQRLIGRNLVERES